MPIYMDVHEGLQGVSQEDVDVGHRIEVEVQEQYGVNVLSYWFSEEEGKAYCMATAPSPDAVIESHAASHGLIPTNVIEVDPPTLAQFLGNTEADTGDRATVNGKLDTGLRMIMFTDIEGSTDVSVEFGDRAGVDRVNRHDGVVRKALKEFQGREIKHTGDGILASFVSVTRALDATIAIQEACGKDEHEGPVLAVKIGLSAGEPVSENRDLYGAAVNLAARICAIARGGQTLVADTVRNLAIGKGHRFVTQGSTELKGFPEPVSIFAVDWESTL